MELILTLGLVSVILGTASGAQNVGLFGAIGVGSYIALAGLWGSPISGASMNPARTFGPDLVGGDFSHYFVYVAGPIAGAVAAVGIAFVLRGRGGAPRARRRRRGTSSPRPKSRRPRTAEPVGHRRSPRESPMTHDRAHAMDHVVLVLFENRSLDNLLGRLYGPGDGKVSRAWPAKNSPTRSRNGPSTEPSEGRPLHDCNRHGRPEPGLGEEYYHTNVQLFNSLEEQNRFKIGEEAREPWNAPGPAGYHDGRLRDRLRQHLTAETAASPPMRSTPRS